MYSKAPVGIAPLCLEAALGLDSVSLLSVGIAC